MVIIHSKDLVNWTIKGHVVSNLRQISEEMNWTRMNRYGRGIWAGAIRYYQGKFYVYFGTPDEGYIIRKSKFPQNPKRSVRFSGKRTKRSVQKRKARNTQKAETKVL